MFTLEQIFNRIPNYKALCDLYFGLAQDEETNYPVYGSINDAFCCFV